MLSGKRVMQDATHMHLWDEIGNFVASYDRQGQRDMCAYLEGMISSGHYALEHQRDGRTQSIAA